MGLADQIETNDWNEGDPDNGYPCSRQECEMTMLHPEDLCGLCSDEGWWCVSCGDNVATAPHGLCHDCQTCPKCHADLRDGHGGAITCGNCYNGDGERNGDAWSNGFAENH